MVAFLSACSTRFEADLGPNTQIRWGTTPSVVPTTYRRDLPVTPFPTRAAIATRSDAQNATIAALEAETMELYAQSVPAVVSIEIPFVHPPVDGMTSTRSFMLSQGSGFLYNDQGHMSLHRQISTKYDSVHRVSSVRRSLGATPNTTSRCWRSTPQRRLDRFR
jgi:hypothetical protein